MPETILFNGTLACNAAPSATAIAVANGKIVAIGRDDEILGLAAADTERLNLGQRLVVPGFIDTHIHFYEWALKRQGLRLDGLTGLEELLERVRAAAAIALPGQWIFGHRWNESDWDVPVMPSRNALDRVAPHHPVLLWRCDLHLAAANTAALNLAGIDAATPDPPEGRIDRDSAGTPTGILRELAINLVRAVVSPPAIDQVDNALADATEALYRRGVTGIHDVRLMDDKDGDAALQAFQRLEQNQQLGLRCWVTLPANRLDDIIAVGLRTGFGNERLRIGHIKFFSDGGMGARTAWMLDPYLDADQGMPLMDMAELARKITQAESAGLAVMVHAVGDRANRELIDIFEKLNASRRGDATLPAYAHRLEHVQMIRPEDLRRLERLDLALNVTPSNLPLDMNLIDTAVGDKGKWTYSFRSLIDTGAPVMFSSDCPVCDPDPLAGIYAAVTRQRTDGTPPRGWYPRQRVTVAEALDAYTKIPATVHKAAGLGVIAAGNFADLTVLSRDIRKVPPPEWADARVDMTLFDGRVVYRSF